ncbi:MAG: DUF5681 domain-containing protein [Stellaceae bacterium]
MTQQNDRPAPRDKSADRLPADSQQITGGTGAERDARGRFQPGQSGNPGGRQRGTRNRASLIAQAMIDGEVEALVRTVMDRALYKDDPVALRLCIERIMSPRRSEVAEFTLPPLRDIADAPLALSAIGQAVSDGALTPAEAGHLSDVVTRFVYAHEGFELVSRLEALEESEAQLRKHGRA